MAVAVSLPPFVISIAAASSTALELEMLPASIVTLPPTVVLPTTMTFPLASVSIVSALIKLPIKSRPSEETPVPSLKTTETLPPTTLSKTSSPLKVKVVSPSNVVTFAEFPSFRSMRLPASLIAAA